MPAAAADDLVEVQPDGAGGVLGGEAELAVHDRGEAIGAGEGGQLAEGEQRAAVVVEAVADGIAVHIPELLAEGEKQVDVRGARTRGELGEGSLAHVVRHTSHGARPLVSVGASISDRGSRC
jgi:hypothetical protein